MTNYDPLVDLDGPRLPQPRVLHCLLPINQTHFFLYGGKEAQFPEQYYRPAFFRIDRWKMYNKVWKFRGIANKTSIDNYIYNWESRQWTKVK